MAKLRHFGTDAAFLPQPRCRSAGTGNGQIIRRVKRNEGALKIWVYTMSAVGLSARGAQKGFAVSVYADVRHGHLFFERQQSLALRGLEWEGRMQPLLPWSALILRGFGVALLASAFLAILI